MFVKEKATQKVAEKVSGVRDTSTDLSSPSSAELSRLNGERRREIDGALIKKPADITANVRWKT